MFVDDIVTVNWENIMTGKEGQFFKSEDPKNNLPYCGSQPGPNFDNCDNNDSGETYGLPYDYTSIMHYGKEL